MSFSLNSIFDNRKILKSGFPVNADKVICESGLKLSVQASGFHYCSPRENEGPYTAVEVGFPSHEVAELMPYAENPSNPTDTVYGYVPVEIVESIILKNGGIKGGAK